MQMWLLGTWLTDELGSAELMVGVFSNIMILWFCS